MRHCTPRQPPLAPCAWPSRYFDPREAHILRARLETEGIPACITGDQHIIVNWPLSVALDCAALQVPEGNAGRAWDIIAACHAGVLEQDLVTAHPEAAEACAGCGATQTSAMVPLRATGVGRCHFLVGAGTFPDPRFAHDVRGVRKAVAIRGWHVPGRAARQRICRSIMRSAVKAVCIGGFLGGALDLAFAIGFAALNGLAPATLLQVIASGWFGSAAFDMGAASAGIGFVSHFALSLGWAALFVGLAMRLRVAARPWLSGPVFGTVVFLGMRLVVLPLSAFPRPVNFDMQAALYDLLSHMFLFGLPIALAARTFMPGRRT